MRNTKKLITNQTEYVCSTKELDIYIENLSELDTKGEISLVSDTGKKYPIQSINGNKVTIDTTGIENYTCKYFTLETYYNLPKMKVTNIQNSYEQGVEYPIIIEKGDWFNSVPSEQWLSLEIFFGEDEKKSTVLTTIFDSEIKDKTIETTFTIPYNAIMASQNHMISFKLYYGNVNSKNYVAETEYMPIAITPSSVVSKTYEAVYPSISEAIITSDIEYIIPIKATIIYENLHPAVSITMKSDSGSTISGKYACRFVDTSNVAVTIPSLSKVTEYATISNLTIALFETPYNSSTDWYSTVAYSSGITGMYYKNVNNKHQLVQEVI